MLSRPYISCYALAQQLLCGRLTADVRLSSICCEIKKQRVYQL